MPKFFLFEEDDVSLLSGNNALWLDFAGRLTEANNGQGTAQTIKVTLAAFYTPPYPWQSENLPCPEITKQGGWTPPTAQQRPTSGASAEQQMLGESQSLIGHLLCQGRDTPTELMACGLCKTGHTFALETHSLHMSMTNAGS